MRTYHDMLDELPVERQEKIKARTNELLLAARLEELRRSRKISQRELASRMQVSQPAIAKMEREPDMKLSTLQRFADGLGGRLKVEIEFQAEGISHTIA